MAMVAADMAEAIRIAMGFPSPASTELIGWSTGVINEIVAAALSQHASGTITGTAPSTGGALTAGTAVSGTVTGMTGASMASRVDIAVGYGSVTTELDAFCDEIVAHINDDGVIAFASGQIIGTCTNTVVSPGPLTGGAGTLGTISGLDGDTLADNVHTAIGFPGGTSTPLKQFCGAVVDYIMANADITYASGAVTATCPAGGGSISAGTGVNGTFA